MVLRGPGGSPKTSATLIEGDSRQPNIISLLLLPLSPPVLGRRGEGESYLLSGVVVVRRVVVLAVVVLILMYLRLVVCFVIVVVVVSPVVSVHIVVIVFADACAYLW